MLIMRKRLAAMAMVGTMLATGIMTGCASGSAPKEEGKTTEQAAGQSVDTGKQEERKEKAKLTLVLRAGSYTDVMKTLHLHLQRNIIVNSNSLIWDLQICIRRLPWIPRTVKGHMMFL